MFLRSNIHVETFETVAMPHFEDLYRTARCMAYNSSEAEDLVQEVYLEAWKSYHRFEAGTNCRAWLFKIMFHRLHHFRRRWFKAERIQPFESQRQVDNVMAEPAVPEEIRDGDILQALEKVPVEFREIVVLADVEEFAYREIAETLKIPLGTVMSRLSRGRKLLRRHLAAVARSYGIGREQSGRRQGESA